MADSKTVWSTASSSVLAMGLAAFVLHQLLHLIVVFAHGDAPYFFCQYDCNWYAGIIDQGYMPEANGDAGGSMPQGNVANWAFFPLFPMIGGAVQALTGLSQFTAVLISAKLIWLPAILAFLAFQRAYAPDIPLWIGATFLTLNPAAIYANAGYTEPLFLLLACLSLTAIRQDKPLTAGTLGALLTATRAVGIGVGLAFAAYALSKVFRKSDTNFGKLMFAGLLIPLGLAAYMTFLHWYVGDAMAFSHIQRAWDRELSNPFGHFWTGLQSGGYPQVMALVSALGLLASGYLMWKGEWGLGLFLVFATVIPLSTGTNSMGRYVLMQPTFLLAVVMLLYAHRWLTPLLGLAALGYLGMSYAWQESLFFVT